MTSENRTQPNKPGGDIKSDGAPRDAGDRLAVRNQGSVTPDDYPEGSNGKPGVPPPPD
jgi:hypothetical protein